MIGAAVVLLRVVPWSIRHGVQGYAALAERAALLARTRHELTSLPSLRDSAAHLSRALIALAPQLLSGGTAAEAASDLSGLVNVAVSRASARIERIDALPDSAASDRLARVRVHAALETDIRGLTALIRAIDDGAETLRLDDLRVEAPDPAGTNRGPEILKVEVTVSGWYVKAREAGREKRAT